MVVLDVSYCILALSEQYNTTSASCYITLLHASQQYHHWASKHEIWYIQQREGWFWLWVCSLQAQIVTHSLHTSQLTLYIQWVPRTTRLIASRWHPVHVSCYTAFRHRSMLHYAQVLGHCYKQTRLIKWQLASMHSISLLGHAHLYICFGHMRLAKGVLELLHTSTLLHQYIHIP